MKIIRNVLRAWLPLALVIVFLCGVIYPTVQQTFRMGANDPQIQMAEDAARALEAGQAPETLVPAAKVDIALSLSPYLVLYSAGGSPSAGNGTLDGALPTLPAGVFETAKAAGEDRITWQPRAGVRSAVIVVPVNGGKDGFVMAGRSLREAEKRVDNLTLQVAVGCAGTLIASLVLVVLLEILPITRSAD